MKTCDELVSSQNVRMGIYERVDTFSERPVYLHTDVDEYLFYMGGRTRGLWMVGPTIGTFRFEIFNPIILVQVF